MEPGDIVRIASLYRSNESNEQVEESRNLYKQMKSSSQSIPDLMNVYLQIDEPKAHFMILDIIYYRIRNYWFEISDETKSQILPFFYEGISPEQVSKYIDNKYDQILSLLSRCQALLASYFYPQDFACWDFVKNFKDKHYCYFVGHFFAAVATPNFETLPHFQQIKSAMEQSADKEVFEKITNIIQSSDKDLVKIGYFAFSQYVKWGANFSNLIENKEFFFFVLESKKIPLVVELINNTIIRLNIECEEFVQNIPLEDIVGHAKELISGLNNQNARESWEYVRQTAHLINTIIVTLDHNPQFLQQINIFQYLNEFISIQDFETTMLLIPSLTYLIQNENEEPEIIMSIVGRISSYFKQKNDPYMESDQLIPNLCNAMSKANPDMLGEYFKAMLDDQNFQNDPYFASAILSSLSYSSEIPISTKFEIFSKLDELYHQPLMPENFQLYFRCFYLIFFLSKLYIPPQQKASDSQSQEQQQQIQEMNEQSKNVVDSVLKIVIEDLFNPENNLGVITNKENFDYQFLKPIRKIISKMRALKQNFEPEFVGFVGSELVKLEQSPEEAAKIIAYFINDDSVEFLVQVLESLNENIQSTKNIQFIDFTLTLISNLKYVKLDEKICNELFSNLDAIHKIVSELKDDKLIGLLYKAYAIIVPHLNIMNIVPQLMELISDKYSLGYSFCLVNAILNSKNAEEFSILQDYISNSTGYLTNAILVLPPTPEDEQFFKETSKYYGSFLKTFFNKNKENLVNVFSQMADIIPHQMEVGYKHTCFIESVTDALIALQDCGVPAEAMVNFLVPSLSFLLNPGFNPAYAQYQNVVKTALRFHTSLIKGSLDNFKSKFEEFLVMIGASQRTLEFAKNYYQFCQEADSNNLQALYQNEFFLVFFNSVISDRNSNNFPSQQSEQAQS